MDYYTEWRGICDSCVYVTQSIFRVTWITEWSSKNGFKVITSHNACHMHTDRPIDRQTDKTGQKYITFSIVWFLPTVNYKNGSIHRLAKRRGVDSVWSHRCIDDNGADGDGDDDDDAFQSTNCCDFPVYCSISMY